ncbi:MAG: DUF368 domain-containing protein [Bacillota bacterium]|nr:DUF368 domain-containing protein [Bacillota bacterium]
MIRQGKGLFYRFLCGFFIGASIIAPGVSGSVIAVMMGIYDDLIGIIANPLKNLKKNVIYMLPLAIGAGVSILFLARVLKWFFAVYPVSAYSLFIGLIAGSLPAVYQNATKNKYKKKYGIAIVLAFAFAAASGFIARFDTVPFANPNNFLYMLVCGGIAGAAGIIPGMSVSMLLMLLGVYTPLLHAVSTMNVLDAMPAAIGFCIGMVLCSKLIKRIFEKYYSLGYWLVFGFMLGSLVSIFPSVPSDMIELLLCSVMNISGLIVSLLFQMLGQSMNIKDFE